MKGSIVFIECKFYIMLFDLDYSIIYNLLLF